MIKHNEHINVAQLLLERYGKDSLSYFALHDKKQFYFSSTGQSFLAYTIEGKTALVSGDPIGPAHDIPLLLKEFTYFVKGAKLSSCFIAVNIDTVQDLTAQGHKHVQLGKEAIIDLTGFDTTFLKKKVRRAERNIRRQGIVCKIYNRTEIPANYLDQLAAVTDEWLLDKGGNQKRLTMSLGRIPSELDRDCIIVLALQDEEVLGYQTYVPVYAAAGMSLDVSMKKKQVPNGLTEFLLIRSLEYFKKNAIKTVSLNFATFYLAREDIQKRSHKVVYNLIYPLLSRAYKTHTLYTFNKKFLPQWQKRYVAFEKKRYIPQYLFAIAKTEL